jgi:hypothetical protein
MSIEELLCVVRPPAKPVEGGDGEKEAMIEKQLGIQLPKDYKHFWRRYGAGCFYYGGRSIHVWNPFSGKFQHDVSFDCDLLRECAGEVPYGVHPKSPGLLPWGSDDEGYTFYWLTEGSTDKWPILVRCREELTFFEQFQGPMTSFLADCFSGEYEAWDPDRDLFSGADRVTFEPDTSSFSPKPTPEHWPATIVQLAEAVSNGQDCSFALHDALLEAGHAELADHFCQVRQHPKTRKAFSGRQVRGCWAIDLIVGNH